MSVCNTYYVWCRLRGALPEYDEGYWPSLNLLNLGATKPVWLAYQCCINPCKVTSASWKLRYPHSLQVKTTCLDPCRISGAMAPPLAGSLALSFRTTPFQVMQPYYNFGRLTRPLEWSCIRIPSKCKTLMYHARSDDSLTISSLACLDFLW